MDGAAELIRRRLKPPSWSQLSSGVKMRYFGIRTSRNFTHIILYYDEKFLKITESFTTESCGTVKNDIESYRPCTTRGFELAVVGGRRDLKTAKNPLLFSKIGRFGRRIGHSGPIY